MNYRFQDIVSRALSFLSEAGFRITKSADGEVLYESNRSFVLVAWDRRSGELNAFVGLASRSGLPQDEYSLVDVMGAQGAATQEAQPPQVALEHRLEPFVEKLSSDLRTHAQKALDGDRMFFRQLEVFRSNKADMQMLDMKLRQVRIDAETAWRSRRHDEVVRLYSSISDHLTESESRRLAYARRQLSA